MRVWHSPWSWLKLMVAAESVAGKTRTGMFTRLILRKPFQVGRAAMGGLSAISAGRVEPASLEVGGRRSEPSPPPASSLQPPTSSLQPPTSALKLIAHLELEHPRRVDVREAGKRVGRRADRHDLAERRVHHRRIAIRRLGAAEDVPVVEQVVAFHPQQDGLPARLDPPFEEQPDVLR